jgi:hypothetical protein
MSYPDQKDADTAMAVIGFGFILVLTSCLVGLALVFI